MPVLPHHWPTNGIRQQRHRSLHPLITRNSAQILSKLEGSLNLPYPNRSPAQLIFNLTTSNLFPQIANSGTTIWASYSGKLKNGKFLFFLIYFIDLYKKVIKNYIKNFLWCDIYNMRYCDCGFKKFHTFRDSCRTS